MNLLTDIIDTTSRDALFHIESTIAYEEDMREIHAEAMEYERQCVIRDVEAANELGLTYDEYMSRMYNANIIDLPF